MLSTIIVTVDFDIFFFSSRRRHTRYWRDWSSDVCSSDLSARPQVSSLRPLPRIAETTAVDGTTYRRRSSHPSSAPAMFYLLGQLDSQHQIGRASCRERV